MKITVFGARGAIGKLTVAFALDRGWEVTAFARDTAGIPSAPGLETVQAELSDEDAIARALRGSAAALTTFGPSFGRLKPGAAPLTNGVAHIAGKMRELGLRRLIVLATPSVRSDEDGRSWRVRLAVRLVRLLIPDAYREITGMGRETMASGLDWTVVRQILPNNRPPSGVVAAGGVTGKTRFAVSRADVARFMLDQAEDRTYMRRLPVIYSKR
ncbi:MAG: NAD(P)H-binding protein [Spirochaetales bacterium]|nr:NAD(P)H-binding protein [Spirochaetales bacterium]